MKFIVVIDELTSEQQDKVRNYISPFGGYWNWISNFWIITTTDTSITANKIYESLI